LRGFDLQGWGLISPAFFVSAAGRINEKAERKPFRQNFNIPG